MARVRAHLLSFCCLVSLAIVPASTYAAGVSDCGRSFAMLYERAKENKQQIISRVLRDGAKITFYPYYFGGKTMLKLFHDGVAVHKIPFQIMKEDRVATTGYAALFATGATPLELYLTDVVGIGHDRLDDEEYFNPDEKGTIVGINGVSEGQRYLEASQYMTGADKADGKTIFQYHVADHLEISKRLMEAYQKSGPIKKLIIAAHGAPGEMVVGGTRLMVAPEDWKNLPKDLFAKDAKVILISCATAAESNFRGVNGAENLKKLFTPLLKQGGEVVASTRYVQPVSSRIPLKYHDHDVAWMAESQVMPLLLSMIETIEFAGLSADSMLHKTKHIKIEPQQ